MSLTNPEFCDRKKISEIKNLPVLPKVMQCLLELKKNENAGVQQLANILVSDPILSAHFLKAANSVFFGTAKQIDSLQDAINRIGFSIVINMAIGISAARSFNIPKEGPIGMRSIWQHAVYTAHIMRSFAIKIPSNQNLNPDMAFLCGLLHNIGFVLLGDQFRDEFTLINNNAKNSHKTLLELEDIFLGIPHTELGVLLMRSWGLPKEIVITIFEHHNQNYKGSYHQYANLAYISNFVLREMPVSDMKTATLPDNLLEALQISESLLDVVQQDLARNKEQLDGMVENLFD